MARSTPKESCEKDEDLRDAINALNPKRHAKTEKTLGASRIAKRKKVRIMRGEDAQILIFTKSEDPEQ